MPIKSNMKPRSMQHIPPPLKKADTYTPPESDIETWGIDKMIRCWEQRDKKCFWENFMWLIDNKRDSSALDITFNEGWQPDLQDDPGSKTRCVTSTAPKAKWWSTIGMDGLIVVPNPFKREDRKITCADINSAGYKIKIEQACREACNNLANGNGTCTGRDTEKMGFEEAGCSGSTAWCWCNSDNAYKKE